MSDDPAATEQWERRVRREWYTIAWPEQQRGTPMLADLFDVQGHPVSFGPEYERLTWHDLETDPQGGVVDLLQRLDKCGEVLPTDQDIHVTVLPSHRSVEQHLFCDTSEHPDRRAQVGGCGDNG